MRKILVRYDDLKIDSYFFYLFILCIFSTYIFLESDEINIVNCILQNVENLSPQIIRRVAKEMTELTTQPPEGIRVILNEADITDIQAVIEGPCKN